MIMSDVEKAAELDDACYYRGLFLSYFAAYEFSFARFIVSSVRDVRYFGRVNDLSYGAEERGNLLRSLLLIEGPLQPFSDRIFEAYAELVSYSQWRDSLAHGFVDVKLDKEGRRLWCFTFYRGYGRRPPTADHLHTSGPELFTKTMELRTSVLAFIKVVEDAQSECGIAIPEGDPPVAWVPREVKPLREVAGPSRP